MPTLTELVGREFWSIWVTHAGRKSSYDERKLAEPWQGRILQRQGGLWTVLAKRIESVIDDDLNNAYYLTLNHDHVVGTLIFETFEEAIEAWEYLTLLNATDKIKEAMDTLRSLLPEKKRLIDKQKGQNL